MKVDFRIELRPLDAEHIEMARRWRNQWAIWRWCRQTDLISDVEQRTWFERQATDPTIKMYRLATSVDGHETTVGICGLTSIDWLNRRAEFSLYVAPEHQRKGYARAGLRLLLDHAFSNLGLNQVWGETFESNPAIKLFGELGFKLDGTRRDFYFKDGRFINAYLVSILASEWRQANDAKRSPEHVDKPTNHDPGPGPAAAPGEPVPPPGRAAEAGEAAALPAVLYEPAIVKLPAKSGRDQRRKSLGARARGKG